MWYHVNKGNKNLNRIAYNTIGCASSRIKAEYIKRTTKKEKWEEIWIEKKQNHSDRNFKQFGCPECNNLMSQKELDDTWDWSGPHCNKCGCTGISMFAEVTKHKPISSGRGVR